MADYYEPLDAAQVLANALARIRDLEAEKEKYAYSLPPQLGDDLRYEAGRVRDAVRYLCSSEADDA